MSKYRITFDVSIHDDAASAPEVIEWIKFHLYNSSMATKNPLIDADMEADPQSVIISRRY